MTSRRIHKEICEAHTTTWNVMQGHARTAWCVDFTCKSLGHTTCLLHDDGPSGPIYVSLHPSHVVFGLVIWTYVVVIEIFDISYISYQKDPTLWLSRHAEKCRKSAGASSTRFRSSKDIGAERVSIRSQWSLRKSFINEMQKKTRLEHPPIWCASYLLNSQDWPKCREQMRTVLIQCTVTQ